MPVPDSQHLSEGIHELPVISAVSVRPATLVNPATPAVQQMSAAMSTVTSMLCTDPSNRVRGHIRLDSGPLNSMPATLGREGVHYEYMKSLGDGVFVRIERNETVATFGSILQYIFPDNNWTSLQS
jgi:hypothetical protein